MRLFYSTNRINDHFLLEDDEFRHSIKVLRQRPGDMVNIIDGSGYIYTCQIEVVNKKFLSAKILSREAGPDLSYRLCIAIAPTKKINRFEWFIEKAVEIGIHSIIPINCSRSEKFRINLERMEKICISAMKQSKNTLKPLISAPIDFDEFLSINFEDTAKYIAYVMEKTNGFSHSIKNPNLIMTIGPEGGFTEDEIHKATKAGFLPVSLGESRLRTETAGVATCQIVKTVFDLLHK